MKFEASRIKLLLRDLDDPRFSGPDGEANVAEFVEDQFAGMGLEVERREVTGSRFPQRLAPWVGWLGYGLLITSVFGLSLTGNIWLQIFAWYLSAVSARWFLDVVRNRVHPGRKRPPVGTAPLLVAFRRDRPPSSMQVIFQAVISGVKADPFHFRIRSDSARFIVHALLLLFPPIWATTFLFARAGFSINPRRPALLRIADFLEHNLYPFFLVPAWIGIVILLLLEYRYRRARAERNPPDRRGLALLLELARAWPRTGSRPIEPVFVVAGGQELDYAGSREVVRLLKKEWGSTPFLLILFFEPGAGHVLWLSTSVFSGEGLGELAEVAARSLWIPHRRELDDALESLWPFVQDLPALALMGSDPRAFGDDSVDPEAIIRAAQLATEVALRWAKDPDISLHPLIGRWTVASRPT
jgi:hypothetical protein